MLKSAVTCNIYIYLLAYLNNSFQDVMLEIEFEGEKSQFTMKQVISTNLKNMYS